MLGPMSSPNPRERRRPKAWMLLALLLTSTVLTLAVLEVALRVYKGAGLRDVPDPTAGVSMIGRAYPGSFDADLGYVPTPGARASNPIWHTQARIDGNGVRSNGAGRPAATGAPIVAVGDSFTYGDEVDDRDTWPAALERVLSRPVINGGVFGYGLDQSVLRSESLLDDFPADRLIVALIADDIDRCEYAYRYAWKPYFDVERGRLVRRNDPVPAPEVLPPGERGVRRWLRASFLADFVLRRLDPSGWLVRGSVRVHHQGEAVSALLVDRLADRAEARGHDLLILIQWHPGADSRRVLPLVARARSRGVDVLALESPLRNALDAPGAALSDLFHVRRVDGREQVGHMTAEGNHLVAAAVAAHLAQDSRDEVERDAAAR